MEVESVFPDRDTVVRSAVSCSWGWVVRLGDVCAVGGSHGAQLTTHRGGGFLYHQHRHTPRCVCVCALGTRAVVASGLRRLLCLLPWDPRGPDWSGGPLARGGTPISWRLWWNQGSGR